MIKNDLFNLMKVFDEIKEMPSNPKFAYAVAKNRKMVDDEVQLVRDAIKPNDDMSAYDTKRIELCREYAQLDDDSNPVIHNSNFVIDPERLQEFNEKIEALREEHRETLDAHKERLIEADKLLKEECDVDFHRVSIDVFPDGLTQEQYEMFMVFSMD